MSNIEKTVYRDMLPDNPKEGHLGYYPVTNYKEWEELPDLYKTMEWDPISDSQNNMSAVKAVIFDVPYMEPYGVRARVSVHPLEVHKILFCSFNETQCLLYSISAVELENGKKLNAQWLQDSISGAFAIKAAGKIIARQGGFQGFIPEHIYKLEDGTFKYDYKYSEGKTNYYELSNPFRNEMHIEKEKNYKNSLDEKISGASVKIVSGRIENIKDTEISK